MTQVCARSRLHRLEVVAQTLKRLRWMLVPVVLLGSALPAAPCSLAQQPPSARELLARAEVVVTARALRVASPPGRGKGGLVTIRFAVIDVLKGSVRTPFLDIRGLISVHDDRNDAPVPYRMVRPGGRGGDCHAFAYRLRGDYLLLLRRADVPFYAELNELTPYWSPHSPTNEQVFGADDPWTKWIRQELGVFQ